MNMPLSDESRPAAPSEVENSQRGIGPLVFANLLFVVAMLAQWVNAAATGDIHFRGHVIGLDFVNTWLGARLMLAGDVSALFDFDAYNALLGNLFGADFPGHMWSYPPHLLLLVAPLGALPYVTAYAVWCLLTWLLFVAGARAIGFRGAELWLAVTSPAITMNIVAGQTGALAGGCLLLALGLSARRPILAGIAAAVLTVKPQLGFLVPVEWLLRRRFKAILAAAATVLLLVGISIVLSGWPAWQGFFEVTLPVTRTVTLSGELLGARLMQPNWSSGLLLLGLPGSIAFTLQSVIALALAAWWLRTTSKLGRGADANSDTGVRARLQIVLFLIISPMATPYIHNYDLVLVVPVVLWAWRDPAVLQLPHRWRRLLLILVWLLPWIMIPLHEARIIAAPIVLTLLAILLLRQADRHWRAQA